MMLESAAPRGSFAFAQQTDERMCHISFTGPAATAVNIQIPIHQIAGMVENLARVMQAERLHLIAEVVRLTDENVRLEKKLNKPESAKGWGEA